MLTLFIVTVQSNHHFTLYNSGVGTKFMVGGGGGGGGSGGSIFNGLRIQSITEVYADV